jgi:phosphoribosylformimino-5-aminoimidazole carboxamide ribotide isomerase
MENRMRFRPCIDLHQGVVKQIVGSTLDDNDSAAVTTNFEAHRPAAWFAECYVATASPAAT